MDPSVNASVMFPQLKLTPTRAAFARPGPHATAFPDVNAPMQPSDSLAPFGRRSGLPSPTTYLGTQGLFFTATPVPTPTRATSETLLPRLPVRRLSSQGETRVSQVPGPSSSCVPWSKTPPGATAPRPLSVRSPSSSGVANTLDTRKSAYFVAVPPSAHTLVCLRIAESVTVSGARLATGPGGLTLGRAGFAPAG